MKNTTFSFAAGALSALLLLSLPASAFAGTRKIEISPISIMVNGELFQPKDAKGNDVMVFTYNGTTYAPLRALADAYGLEVGYDAARHLATVNQHSADQPLDTGYTGFASAWTVKEKPVTDYGNEKIFTVTYSGGLGMEDFKRWWKSYDSAALRSYAERMIAEVQRTVPDYIVTAYFSYGAYGLGTVYAQSGYAGSNFDVAKAWIK